MGPKAGPVFATDSETPRILTEIASAKRGGRMLNGIPVHDRPVKSLEDPLSSCHDKSGSLQMVEAAVGAR
jgi:hypothetical protein